MKPTRTERAPIVSRPRGFGWACSTGRLARVQTLRRLVGRHYQRNREKWERRQAEKLKQRRSPDLERCLRIPRLGAESARYIGFGSGSPIPFGGTMSAD